MITACLLLTGAVLCGSPTRAAEYGPPTHPRTQDPTTPLVAQLLEQRDDADVALIEKIAATKTRAAMEGLLEAYDAMSSVYMRREIVYALGAFDGVAAAQEPALEKIANVATGSETPELRDAAVQTLGDCEKLGKHFLAAIVESDADDDVRQQAIELHAQKATAADAEWYRGIWKPKPESEREAKADEPELPELQSIREVAFGALAGFMDEAELAEVLETEPNAKIRRLALSALHDQGAKRTRGLAAELFGSVDAPGADRALAAEILATLEGPSVATDFLKLAKKKAVTPEDLRTAMAQLIVDMDDRRVNQRVARLVGRGKPHEKIFALRATRHLDDPKLLRRIRKGLEDRDFAVRRTTAQVLAERRDKAAVPQLRELLDKPRTPGDLRVAIEAIDRIIPEDPKWVAQLEQLAGHEDRDVRNAALSHLGHKDDPEHLPILLDALEHPAWSTRALAIEALVARREKEAVPALVERLPEERGRMAQVVTEALWSLTGKPFEGALRSWRTWWQNEGAGFSVLTLDELAKAEEEREMRRLRDRDLVVRPEFFGVEIVSHRVIFVIDTSGSMSEPMRGRLVGKRTATRIDVAKEQLQQCIRNLDPSALFNVVAFSSGVDRWLDEGLGGNTENTRTEAATYVERLGAGGGTNLYDAIATAFDDPDVDTIFILSDGEPTVGAVTDPHQIREDVSYWNAHRKIEINTIAIGGSLDVLEWIAEDAGGDYLRFR